MSDVKCKHLIYGPYLLATDSGIWAGRLEEGSMGAVGFAFLLLAANMASSCLK